MRIPIPFKLTGLVVLSLLADVVAFGDVLPGSVMPEQVAKSLKPGVGVTPTGVATQNVIHPQNKAPTVSAAEQKITFKLNGINLTGNHVYTTKELEPIYKDKIGKTISIADLFQITQNITNFYRNNGYIISFATLPPQKSKSGVINIQIVEGYINNVTVTGDPRYAKCLVEGMGHRIRKCPPLQLSKLEKYMLLENEIPNTSVKAVLSPSKTGLGAADLNLVAYSKPVSAYFSLDDYGTLYIGPQQITGNTTLYSVASSGDSLSFTYTKTPKGTELTFADVDYNSPLGDSGARWILGRTYTHTHPQFVLTESETDGLTNNYYTSFIFPVIRTRSQSMNATVGFNYLNSNTYEIAGLLYNDHIRSLDLGFNFNFADRYRGANMITGDFRKGLPIFGYTTITNLSALTSRPGGHAKYNKITGQISRLQSLVWNFSALAVLKGQWAFEPLLSSEQFTFGGNPLGRGYDPAEIIGDRGASGSLELRYDWNIGRIVNTLQFYTFYDMGAIWNILVDPTSPAKISASSTGLGVRFTMSKYISGNIMWAQPLTKQVAAEEFIGDGWNPRLFFSVVASLD